MTEFAEKPPMEQRQMVERPSTLQDLFDSERRGIKAVFKADAQPELSQQTAAFENAWQQNFGKLKHSLDSQLTGNATQLDPQRRAQLEVSVQQLDDLNALQPGERVAMFKAFKDNSVAMRDAQSAADGVLRAMQAGAVPVAIQEQRDLVKIVSGLNQKATSSVIASTEKVLGREKDPEVLAALEQSLDDARAVVAAPFVEKARLGAFLLNDQKPYQAEDVLKDALNTAVSGEGWKLKTARDLRANVKDQTSQLYVQNNLVELYDQNVDKLDPSHNKHVLPAELAAAKGTGDENFVALTKFLTENYEYLTRHHWPIVSKQGISPDDVRDYVKERSSQINDLKLH